MHNQSQTYVGAFLILCIGAVGIYDIVCKTTGNTTVSAVLWDWSTQYPILPFVIGVIIGHLFWSQR